MFSSRRKAFTMIELTFAIVIIGILASVAIPRLAATRDDAEIVRAKTTISSLRSALATERQKRVLRGIFTEITSTELLDLLPYGESILKQGWEKPASTNGQLFIFTGPGNKTCSFSLENNQFVKKTCYLSGMDDI